MRHLKSDEILLLCSLTSSESPLFGTKALKNSIEIPSGPQALKLRVDEIAFANFFTANILVYFLLLLPWSSQIPKCIRIFPEFFGTTTT